MSEVQEEEIGSGDVAEPKFSSEFPPEEPPRPPDVELIQDSFGILPKDWHPSSKARQTSKVFDVGSLEYVEEEETASSPCQSSSNINVVRRFTWKTVNRMTVQVITYGATFTCIQVPDRKGTPDDVIGGFDDLEGYLQPNNPYFGASVGRCANIIYEGSMRVRSSGKLFALSTNRGRHHYHGGYIGFDKVNWRSHVNGNQVILSHVSERYSEGYPGTLMTQITIECTVDNTIKVDIRCSTSEPTIVNISYQPFFNMGGHYAGPEEMYKHIFTINADKYTPVDEKFDITGQKKVVGGTPFDFRVPRILSSLLPKIPLGGYDVNYCITRGSDQELTFVARALHPPTGRVLEVYSNQPGVQFYTGNLLPDPDRIIERPPDVEESETAEGEEGSVSERDGEGESEVEGSEEGKVGVGYVPLIGKQNTHYRKHGLFCLMPQKYPDAVNHKTFPSPVLNPGEFYHHKMQYKFGLLLGNYT